MNNKPILNVDREIIEKALRDALTIRFDADSHVTNLRALLDKPAAQPQGDPVYMARDHGSCCWEEMKGESLEVCQAQPAEYEVRKLYAEQPASVAVVPERLAQILKFLDGADGLDGHWFGEPGPTGSLLWWRDELRKALTETNLFAKQQ